ncbi:VOC family protein [Paenibacillus terrigena]|nr:VOC family protein [Paenibacillus terrigena]
MIEFQNLHHVSIAVRDLQKAKPFYAEVLQFQVIERTTAIRFECCMVLD